jgi:hypothetical protein
LPKTTRFSAKPSPIICVAAGTSSIPWNPGLEPGSPLTDVLRFDTFTVMETSNALLALAALAQESRLAVYRLLVEHAPDGLPAGEIAERLGTPAPSLSFHLCGALDSSSPVRMGGSSGIEPTGTP